MCRIFGHVKHDACAAEMDSIAEMLHHGGPDGRGVYIGPGCGVGATRLAITDPGGGNQPYELGAIRVVFNGEIYNHEQLRRMLAAKGHRFDDRCDGSVIAPLYLRYGTDFVDHLDGMYAVAVLDLRGEPRLALAVDECGIKPLYYTLRAGGGICFASEIPALLAFPGVDAAIRPGALDEYLSTKAILGERTWYERVKTLEPGSVLTYSLSGGLRLRRSLSGYRQSQAGHPDLQSAGRAVRRALRREVRRLARADVPVAAICSGGLDSSLVTALLAESAGDVTAFHIGYGAGWPHDELDYARSVAARAGVGLHEAQLRPESIPSLIPSVVRHLGQPNADPITVSTFALFREVSAAGFKAALSGDGADEFFGGYDRIKAAVSAQGDWISSYVDGLAAVPRWLRDRLYTGDYGRDPQTGSTASTLAQALRSNGSDRLGGITRWEVGKRLPGYHLRRVDHLSMASAVEVRVPFCQRSMARLAFRIAGEHKIQDGQGKRVLYRAAEGKLPESVLSRPKQPFTLPVTAMLRAGGPLYDFVREILSTNDVGAAGQLDPLAVKQLLAAHERRATDVTAMALWTLMILQVWLQGAKDENGDHRLR